MTSRKEQSTTSIETDSRINIGVTDEDISFEKRLESFPHSFHLTDLMFYTKMRREKLLKRLQQPEEDIPTSVESHPNEKTHTNRRDNFTSFLVFLLGDREKAMKINLKVRDRDPANIVARANRVRFLLKQDKCSAESELEELENLKGDLDRMRAVAKAELAYCYARISTASYPKALKLYRQLNEKYHEEYEWKFDEALTLRRSLSFQSFSFLPDVDVVEYAVRCCTLLQEVCSHEGDRLNYMAYAELGDLAKLLELRWTPFEDKKLVEEVHQETGLLSREEYFQKALDLGKEDPFILVRCANHFLNTQQLDEAEKMLEESVSRRRTTKALHQLGKVLRKKARKQNNPETLDRAIRCLKEAVEITDNYPAEYDLALAYMSKKYYEDAEQHFKIVTETADSYTDPFPEINALKNMSFICSEKSENCRLSSGEKTRLKEEEMNYKILAIEASASEVLYKYRTHFRTVTELLKQTNGPRGVEIPWQVKDVYSMISKFAPSLPIDGKVQTGNLESEDWIAITEEYLNQQQYINARLCVSLLMGTEQADDIPIPLVKSIYLKSAQHMLSRGQSPRKAWSCFRRLFSVHFRTKKEVEINGADVMILHDKDDWKLSKISNKIQEILQSYTGLKVTRNDELAFEGMNEISFYEQLMPLIRCIVVIVNSDTPDTHWKKVIDLALDTAKKEEKMMIVCLKSGETHQVTELNDFKTGKTPPDEADDKAAVDWLLETFPLLVNADVNL